MDTGQMCLCILYLNVHILLLAIYVRSNCQGYEHTQTPATTKTWPRPSTWFAFKCGNMCVCICSCSCRCICICVDERRINFHILWKSITLRYCQSSEWANCSMSCQNIGKWKAKKPYCSQLELTARTIR